MDVCPEDFTSCTATKAAPNLAEQVWTLSNERPKAVSDMEAEFHGFLARYFMLSLVRLTVSWVP